MFELFVSNCVAPEPPTSLQFSKLTPTSYSFSWVPPAVTNGILIAHMISCDPQLDGLEVITRSAGSDEISGVVVENLEKGVTYECFVQVQNNVGLSLPSSPVTFTTDEAGMYQYDLVFKSLRIVHYIHFFMCSTHCQCRGLQS